MDGCFQNHNEKHCEEFKSQACASCVHFIMATHGDSEVCMTPACLYALPTTSGQAPDESVGGVLGELFLDLDQDISEFLNSS